jgi:aryl-alcohol dehydrogenase-like predicted oxidoreductase
VFSLSLFICVQNLELVSKVEALAAKKGCTPAQLALAWLLAQGA